MVSHSVDSDLTNLLRVRSSWRRDWRMGRPMHVLVVDGFERLPLQSCELLPGIRQDLSAY